MNDSVTYNDVTECVGAAHRPDAEWTEQNGKYTRTRTYRRKDPTRPGTRERRMMAQQGLSWCRGCADWLPTDQVRSGVCRTHCAEEYRANYAKNPHAIRARAKARKRGIDPFPRFAEDYLSEQFNGRCAYCPAKATTWDHVLAVVRGGKTEAGNMVPACVSCNSSKKDADVFDWLLRKGREPSHMLIDVLALQGGIHFQ